MIKKKFHKLKHFLIQIIKQSWFFSASLFLGLIITGNIKSTKNFFATLILCLIFWLLDFLFLKKAINKLMVEIFYKYKKYVKKI